MKIFCGVEEKLIYLTTIHVFFFFAIVNQFYRFESFYLAVVVLETLLQNWTLFKSTFQIAFEFFIKRFSQKNFCVIYVSTHLIIGKLMPLKHLIIIEWIFICFKRPDVIVLHKTPFILWPVEKSLDHPKITM